MHAPQPTKVDEMSNDDFDYREAIAEIHARMVDERFAKFPRFIRSFIKWTGFFKKASANRLYGSLLFGIKKDGGDIGVFTVSSYSPDTTTPRSRT